MKSSQEDFLKTQPGYQSTDYGPGSEFWTKGSATAGLLAGALGGNLKAGAAAGAAPLLAELVSKQDDPTLRAVLYGIVAAALTQASGGSGSDGMKAGAIGTITASAMTDHLVSALYGKEVSELTADEKRLVSSLVTIAGGLAGAAVTDGDLSMAALASNTATVEIENNSLRDKLNPPIKIIDINQLGPKFLDEHGDPLVGGGGIRNTYNSIKNAPLYPQGFRPVQNVTVKNTVNYKDILNELRAVESGKWSKVYKDGYDASGNRVSMISPLKTVPV